MKRQLFVKDKQFYKDMAYLALPFILQNIITIGVNIMDTMMVGSLGEVALSATSLANNYIEIFHIFTLGLGGGAGVLIAQHWGRKDKEAVKKVINIMIRICICAVVLFSVVAAVIPGKILKLYTPDVDVIEQGASYLLWSLPTFFLHGMAMIMSMALRYIKKVKVPFYSSIVSFFFNIFFNWLFIFGNLGAPKMGVAGAALGTVCARISEFLVIGIYFIIIEDDLGMRFKDLFKPCKDFLKPFVKYGTPVIVSDVLLSFGNSAISIIMGHIGTSFVAANAAVSPVMRLCNVATMGLSMATSATVGHTIGQGRVEDAKEQGKTCFLLSFATGLLAGLLVLIICPRILSVYSMTEETKAIADSLIKAISIVLVFQATQAVLTKGVLRGGGDTRFVRIADVLFLWVLSIPLGALCGLVWKLSPFVIYVALKCDFIIKTLWCSKRLYSGVWIKKVYE